jgi:hypothetical protein
MLSKMVLPLVALALIFGAGAGVAPRGAHAAPPSTATPHYYYDRETAFIINHAIDPIHGGLFVAVNADGALLEDFLPVEVWGFPPDVVRGVSKSHIGQGTCIRYFINEYLRAETSGVGVAGVNTFLRPNRAPLTAPLDLLGYARSCADFIARHMEVPPDDGISEPPNASGLLPPGADQGDLAIPNRLFYWGFTNRDGVGELVDDTLPNGGRAGGRPESIIPWSVAELALVLQRAGRPETEWGPYRDTALRWWNWRRTTAQPLPPYGDPNLPFFRDGCGGLPDNPDTCIPGIGRDIFYPALGYALAELTGDPTYREGDGSTMADGTPYGGRPFANSILGTGNAADLTFPPPHGMQDGAYPAGHARSVIFAWETQRLGSPLADRDQYWDFSIYPALVETGRTSTIRSLSDQSIFGDSILRRPFAHFAGREVVAGTQRAHWMFATFGVNPNSFYANPNLRPEAFRQAAYDYWNFANATFWDDTPGQQAWFEALGQPYKPCFAGGTDLPLGDWLAPVIASKVHSPDVPQPGEPVTVTVGGVRDPDWPYLSMSLTGSGVQAVEVRYSIDGGATWVTLPATAAGADYLAVIPGQPGGTRVLYYARARDLFGNWAAFPAATERWNSDGSSTVNPLEAQSYQPVPPTSVNLTAFTATRQGDAVEVRWETSAERETWGFHLLRSSTGRRADATQVTPRLIPAEGRAGGGASYRWRDENVQPGVIYSYWLRELERDGAAHEYGPASSAPRQEAFGVPIYLPWVGRP